MQTTYGNNLKLSIFGTSHGPEIGMILSGIPAGLPVDPDNLQTFLARRSPGQNHHSSPRKEPDIPHFFTGLSGDETNGEPIHAVIYNENVQKTDYADLQHIPRPGHADYTAWMKYGLDFDMSGGGPFSGRMTAAMCIAGGLCKQWLEMQGVRIHAEILQIGTLHRDICPNFSQAILQEIQNAKEQGDSVGGRVCCTVTGLPVGLGGELFSRGV